MPNLRSDSLMFFVELRLYTVSALTVRVVILPDFSAARAFAAATRIWREIPPFYPHES